MMEQTEESKMVDERDITARTTFPDRRHRAAGTDERTTMGMAARDLRLLITPKTPTTARGSAWKKGAGARL